MTTPKTDNGVEYNYFIATLYGWNGSNRRIIAKVDGCWDSEQEAQDALDAKCIEKQQDYADKCGIDFEEAGERSGWLADYQRTTVEFEVTPVINGRLDHDQMQCLAPGELPEFNEAAE